MAKWHTALYTLTVGLVVHWGSTYRTIDTSSAIAPENGDGLFDNFGEQESQPALNGEAANALNSALQVVGKTASKSLRRIMDTFEPTFMLVGGTSQAKDSLMMMMMGLPFAFQASGIGTRVPVLYRTVNTGNTEELTVNMLFDDGLDNEGEAAEAERVAPESVVGRIQAHMQKYAHPPRFGDVPIKTLITGKLESSVYINMMGRVVGVDERSKTDSAHIDAIYQKLAAPANVFLIAVEKTQTNPQNSMITPFTSEVDPSGKRTIYVKTWADYGLDTYSVASGKPCREVQDHFATYDFHKGKGGSPTFWIATVEAEPYLQDQSLSFEERRMKLNEAIEKKQKKMDKFIADWKEQGCVFDWEKYTNVEALRSFLSNFHSQKVMEKLPELVKELRTVEAKQRSEKDALEALLKSFPKSSSNMQELYELVVKYKALSDELWTGEGLPQADGVTQGEIWSILKTGWNMTAAELFERIAADYEKEGLDDSEEFSARKLVHVSTFLSYGQAVQRLSYSLPYWNHLSNALMLLFRTTELEEPNTLHDMGMNGIAGPSLCNSAALSAQKKLKSMNQGTSIMLYAMKWILRRHQKVVRNLLWTMPLFKAHAQDKALNAVLDRTDEKFVDEWTSGFESEYKRLFRRAALNMAQGKIMQVFARNVDKKASSALELNGLKKEQCPTDEMAEAWKDQGFTLLYEKTDKSRAYVKCKDLPEGPDNEYKVSCVPSECDGDDWCFVKKHCGRFGNPCKKLKSAYTPTCPTEEKIVQMAKVLGPPQNCTNLYRELVDSGLDLIIVNLGSLLTSMMFNEEDPIRKNPRLVTEMYNRLIGDRAEEDLAAEFTSLGQRRLIENNYKKMEKNVKDLNAALNYFREAMQKGQNILGE